MSATALVKKSFPRKRYRTSQHFTEEVVFLSVAAFVTCQDIQVAQCWGVLCWRALKNDVPEKSQEEKRWKVLTAHLRSINQTQAKKCQARPKLLITFDTTCFSPNARNKTRTIHGSHTRGTVFLMSCYHIFLQKFACGVLRWCGDRTLFQQNCTISKKDLKKD